jgi:hypothetical protein
LCAKLLNKFGTVYDTEKELVEILKNWRRPDITAAYDYVTTHHLIKNTVDNIENVLKTE